jgi:hypothetical protein
MAARKNKPNGGDSSRPGRELTSFISPAIISTAPVPTALGMMVISEGERSWNLHAVPGRLTAVGKYCILSCTKTPTGVAEPLSQRFQFEFGRRTAGAHRSP